MIAGVAAAIAITVTSAVSANAVDDVPDLHLVDEDLRGMVLVMGGEVFDETLEPVADVEEYEQSFEDAGFDVSDAAIRETLPGEGIALAPDMPTEMGFGRGISGRVGMEAPGCGGHDQYRKLQTLTRGGKNGVVAKGIALRMCGNSAWGWRHIDIRHAKHWGNIGVLFGRSWDSFAIWAMYGILGSPQSINYKPQRDTFLYTAPIQLWKNGKLVTTYMPKVSVANKTWRIITAYPTTP